MPVCFISAENPSYSSKIPLRRNNAMMYQLLKDLRRLVPDKNIRLCQFIDRTGYTEKSFRVSGIRIDDAVRLAHKYGQESILVEGQGLLHMNTMMINPILGKYTGKEASQRGTFNIIEGMLPVSFDIDVRTERKLN